MRRHYTAYFKGIIGFKPYRMRLVEATDVTIVNEILEEIGASFIAQNTLLV